MTVITSSRTAADMLTNADTAIKQCKQLNTGLIKSTHRKDSNAIKIHQWFLADRKQCSMCNTDRATILVTKRNHTATWADRLTPVWTPPPRRAVATPPFGYAPCWRHPARSSNRGVWHSSACAGRRQCWPPTSESVPWLARYCSCRGSF